MEDCGLNLYGSGHGTGPGSCEHATELSGPTKDKKCLHYQIDSWLLRKDTATESVTVKLLNYDVFLFKLVLT
jgi:hypothetical protein